MSASPSPSTAAAKAPPQRLTLEEKLWFDRRKDELQQCGGFGAAVGAATGAALTSFWPFPRRMQLATIVGMIAIGGGVGYLYAESQALARVQDLSASSQLRKQYQQLSMEKKASKKKE